MFKDYPINDLNDRASLIAEEASYCAADQGKYWEYHDKVCVCSTIDYLYNNHLEDETPLAG